MARQKPQRAQRKAAAGDSALPALPHDVPVEMPELPKSLAITTLEQFKAVSDPVRSRILGVIRAQPATAKQIADRLKASPGAIGYHLRVLEAAGLAQVVARRVTNGIIAKYYTRTARIFQFDLPPELVDKGAVPMDIMTRARGELADALADARGADMMVIGFPHARLSDARARLYAARVEQLEEDLLNEPADPNGQMYGLCVAWFMSPAYMQSEAAPAENQTTDPAPAKRRRRKRAAPTRSGKRPR